MWAFFVLIKLTASEKSYHRTAWISDLKKIFKNSDDCLSIPTLSWKENDTLVLDLCSPDCFHPLTELQSYRGSYISLLNCLVCQRVWRVTWLKWRAGTWLRIWWDYPLTWRPAAWSIVRLWLAASVLTAAIFSIAPSTSCATELLPYLQTPSDHES